jgi:formate hydrogenlyase subunit 6/NADH:ubiquinone oxidoreductase subunit I
MPVSELPGDFPTDAGIPALWFSASGSHRCTGCDLCVQICPSRALRLATSPSEGSFDLTRFELEVGGCIGCGRCVEECPEEALLMRATPSVAIAQRSGRPEPIDLLDPGEILS